MLLKSHVFNNFSLKLIVFSTIFCVILSFLVSEFLQNLLIFSGILSFGIIHGANDILLLKKSLDKNINSIKFLIIVYLIMVILFGFFFYLVPFLALLSFILLSSYHFGEQQWTMFTNKKKSELRIFYFIYGLFIFSLLFWSNGNFVSEIIYDISSIKIEILFYKYLLYTSAGGLILSFFFTYKYLLDQIILQVFLLILLSLIFYNFSLIYSFGIYFVFWHSIPSIIDQSIYIYGSSDLKSFLNYFKSSIIYWIISMIGLLILYSFLKNSQTLLISIFFSFLAAITFPHAIVISKIKNSK